MPVMARLPVPGEDAGFWGNILNEFLNVEHNVDGSLKSTGSLATKADDTTVVHNSGAETITGTKTFAAPLIIPTPTSAGHATTKAYVDTVVASGATNATTGAPGLVQLAGDLGGSGTTATAPVISDGAITNSKIANGAISTNKLTAGSVTSNEIADGTITNTDISSSAAIAKSKLASLSIVDADVSSISEPKIAHTVVVKSSTYAVTTSDEVILVNASGGSVTVTLPTAVSNTHVYTIKKIDTSGNTVVVNTTSLQTIDGGASATLKIQYASISLVSDGSNWLVI